MIKKASEEIVIKRLGDDNYEVIELTNRVMPYVGKSLTSKEVKHFVTEAKARPRYPQKPTLKVRIIK